MKTDDIFMHRALELSLKGAGNVKPNPMVGAVIVHNNMIIGEGYHYRYGGPHAEVVAIENTQKQHLLPESTLYVTLEPCIHYGKTPPCAHLIVQKKIKKVVIGTIDPTAKVAVKGIEYLQEHNVEVICGILEANCRFYNRRFFIFHKQNRPYIILKWAKTLDGFIDSNRENNEKPHINWITQKHLKMLVHQWRHEEPAIVTGAQTVINDNPNLTTREWPGKNPLRVILATEQELPKNANVLDNKTPTIIFTYSSHQNLNNTMFFTLNKTDDVLEQICRHLFELNIQSIIVEGGKYLLESFIKRDLWDEARIFTGNITFGSGLVTPVIPEPHHSSYIINNDRLSIWYNHKTVNI
jgi:diaminohydroxyphosphoribosylaminopyrimidine deaminase/5-amino-6-(5-phosphoribosylamino)uracil reductase